MLVSFSSPSSEWTLQLCDDRDEIIPFLDETSFIGIDRTRICVKPVIEIFDFSILCLGDAPHPGASEYDVV